MRAFAKVPSPARGQRRGLELLPTSRRKGWTVGPALRGPGRALDARTEEVLSAKLGFPLASVRIHADPEAARAAESVGARAFTIGRNVYFGAGQYQPHSPEGQQLLAHELTHVAQQRASPLPGEGVSIPPATRADELPARRVARAAAEHGHPLGPVGVSSMPTLAMDEAPPVSGADAAARVVAALNRPDPVAGVGDPGAALDILRSLGTDERIDALIEVDAQGLLDVLVGALAANDVTPVGAAIYAVRFTSPNGTASSQFGVQAARGIALLPQAEQDALVSRVLSRRGSSASVDHIREGIEALLESEAALDAAGEEEVDDLSAPPTPLVASVAMGPWNPGRMPVPFYIGNSAHVAIAAEYAGLHRGDAAFYNFSPVASILDAARALGVAVNPLALRAAQLGLRPDITNLTRRHLYEIKPAAAQAAGRAEARLYMAAFAAAGLPIVLGPVTEPGTTGTVPAPGGWYLFTCPEPGVITYRYRQPRRRRLRAPVPQPSPLPVPSRSFMQQMQQITGLTGAALVIYVIISEGTRIIPLRNAIPVP